MRVGLIADIHSNLEALKAVLHDMPRVDMMLCAGDIVGWCARPGEVIKTIRRRKMLTVKGEHDEAAASGKIGLVRGSAAEVIQWTKKKLGGRELGFLGDLPLKQEITISDYKILMVHGSPLEPLRGRMKASDLEEMARSVRDTDADVIVVGHTHFPFQKMVLGKLVINPGSVGLPKDRDPRASYALLELGREIKVVHRKVEYDVERTKLAIRRAGLPGEIAVRLSFGW